MLLLSLFLRVIGLCCVYLAFGRYVGIVKGFYFVGGIVIFYLGLKMSPLRRTERSVGDGGSSDHDFEGYKQDDSVPEFFYAYGIHGVDTTTYGWEHAADGNSAYNRVTGESVTRNSCGGWNYSEGDEENE